MLSLIHIYSSTDLSQFYPYTESSQLVELQEPSTFTIENEKDMPILDGAEACYPVYSAIAKAVYKDIGQIEKAYSETEDYNYYNTNGKIVTFTNTSVGYTRLINGEVDMFFGAKPSQSQLDEAREAGVEFEYTPIGQEAFVFFVNKDNPVSNLSTQQIKDIYHGEMCIRDRYKADFYYIKAYQIIMYEKTHQLMRYNGFFLILLKSLGYLDGVFFTLCI